MTGARSTLVTVQVKGWLVVSVPSKALTVTLYTPAPDAVSVPLIRPVVALIVSGAGRPVALKVTASPSGSLATTWSAITALSGLVWFGIAVITGARSTLVTVQVKGWLVVSVPSKALTVTLYTPAPDAVSVPLMRPVVALIVSGAGRPVALKVTASPSGSLATTWSAITAPSGLVWFGIEVVSGARSTLVTVQVKGWLVVSVPSKALTTTG